MKVCLSPFAASFSLQALRINLFQYPESGGGWSGPREEDLGGRDEDKAPTLLQAGSLDTHLNSSGGTCGVGGRGSRVGSTGKAFGFLLSILAWLT